MKFRKVSVLLIILFLGSGCAKIASKERGIGNKVLAAIVKPYKSLESKIVLKKRAVDKPPFKLEPGSYQLEFDTVTYPDTIFERAEFWNEFLAFSTKMMLAEKKCFLLLSEECVGDLAVVKNGELTEKEKIFYVVASSLQDSEKESIRNILNIEEKENEKLTTQDYLNMQVKIMLKILGKESDFESGKIYTELEKENIVNKIKSMRKMVDNSLKKSKIAIIVSIKDPYNEIKKEKEMFYKKDIRFYPKGSFSERVSKYEYPIYIQNINSEDAEKIFNMEIKVKNRVVFVENSIYHGYRYEKGDFLFFRGGEKESYQYQEYKIDFNVENKKLEIILTEEQKYGFSDIIGG